MTRCTGQRPWSNEPDPRARKRHTHRHYVQCAQPLWEDHHGQRTAHGTRRCGTSPSICSMEASTRRETPCIGPALSGPVTGTAMAVSRTV
jgi:hypothetical protein